MLRPTLQRCKAKTNARCCRLSPEALLPAPDLQTQTDPWPTSAAMATSLINTRPDHRLIANKTSGSTAPHTGSTSQMITFP